MTEFNIEIAMETFNKRVEENKDNERIDNGRLPAGAPMYFYCRKCGDSTDVLPESYLCTPKTICDPCKVLANHGLI